MRQLSVYMAKHNRTKLPQQASSTLFAFDARSSLDVFFSNKPLESAVRATVPIRISGGFLTFIHKTIMEHSVAIAVVGGVEAAVAASGVSPQQLIEVSMCLLQDTNAYCHLIPSPGLPPAGSEAGSG